MPRGRASSKGFRSIGQSLRQTEVSVRKMQPRGFMPMVKLPCSSANVFPPPWPLCFVGSMETLPSCWEVLGPLTLPWAVPRWPQKSSQPSACTPRPFCWGRVLSARCKDEFPSVQNTLTHPASIYWALTVPSTILESGDGLQWPNGQNKNGSPPRASILVIEGTDRKQGETC